MATMQVMIPTQGTPFVRPAAREWYHSPDSDGDDDGEDDEDDDNDNDNDEQSESEPPSEDENGFRPFTAWHAKRKQYILEKLLKKRVIHDERRRCVQYLVRWAGDWPKSQKQSWSDEHDIDEDTVNAYNAAHSKKIAKSKTSKKAQAEGSGVHALLDIEAAEGRYESDEESPEGQEDDDFFNDEGDEVDSDAKDSDAEDSDADDDNDSGSEYTPSDDEMEVEYEGSNEEAAGNDVSESDQEDMDVGEQAPAETSKNGAADDEASDSDSDSEEDAEGEDISEEELALYASRSIFGK